MSKAAFGVAVLLVVALLPLAQVNTAQLATEPAPPAAGACSSELSTAVSTPSSPRIIDISLGLSATSLEWGSSQGQGPEFRKLTYCNKDSGDICNGSGLKMSAHSGTHLDAPGHFIQEEYLKGVGVESLDLYTLNGPVLVVQTPLDTNLTAEVCAALPIPPGTTRLILKTLNTERRLIHQTAFDTSYTSFTKDGADWLAAHTDVKLVGVDYLSVAYYDDLVGPHVALLSKGIIPVEGLVLDEVAPGLYMLHCLPTKIVGSDGAPVRCILMQ